MFKNLKDGFEKGLTAAEEYFPSVDEKIDPLGARGRDNDPERKQHYRVNYLFYTVGQAGDGSGNDSPALQSIDEIISKVAQQAEYSSVSQSGIEAMGYFCFDNEAAAEGALSQAEKLIQELSFEIRQELLFGELSLSSGTGYVTTPRSALANDQLIRVKEFASTNGDVTDLTERV